MRASWCKVTVLTGMVAMMALADQVGGADVELQRLAMQSKGVWSPALREAYLKQVRSEMMSKLKKSGLKVSSETIAWVDGHDFAQQAVYGSVYPADVRILLNLEQLRSDLGAKTFEKYAQFCVGAAVARRSIGVGPIANAHVNLKFTKLYDWGDVARAAEQDPAQWLAGRERQTKSVAGSAALASVKGYLKKNSLSPKAAYTSEPHRKALENILTKSGLKKPERALPGVLHQVMVGQGVRPEKRGDHPRVADYLKFLDRIHSTPKSKMALEAGQKWPLYPVKESPWPILMPLSMAWPLDEAEYIWQKYQGKHGGKRLHTYGPYNRFPVGVDNSLDKSQWHWSAWPSVITTGGVCGTMSSIANGTYTSLGVPIVKAGQPGHSCIVRYDINVKGEYLAGVGQSATGGPDKTTAPWLFADGQNTRNRGKYSVYSEHHYGLAQGMNVGLESYLDTRMAMHFYNAMTKEEQAGLGRRLVLSALDNNPCNIEAWYVLARDTRSGEELAGLLLAFGEKLQVDAMMEKHSDRDVSADLGEDKVSAKQSVDSKVATLRHIGLEQMAVIGLRDIKRFSKADLQLVIGQLNELIKDGNNHLAPMLDRCLCEVNGPEAIQSEITKNLQRFLNHPPKERKNVRRVSGLLTKRIAAVAAVTESRQQREQWLMQLTGEFSPKQKVVVSKKKGKQIDKFYASISGELVKSLKSKPRNKKGLKLIRSEHAALLKG